MPVLVNADDSKEELMDPLSSSPHINNLVQTAKNWVPIY